MGGRDLASSLNQRAVGIKEKLRVVQGSAVTLVDADGDNDARLQASPIASVARDGTVTDWSSSFRNSPPARI